MQSLAAEPKQAPALLREKIVTVEDVKTLFDMSVSLFTRFHCTPSHACNSLHSFFTYLQPQAPFLDRDLHTPTYTSIHTPFLFTCSECFALKINMRYAQPRLQQLSPLRRGTCRTDPVYTRDVVRPRFGSPPTTSFLALAHSPLSKDTSSSLTGTNLGTQTKEIVPTSSPGRRSG